jgi:YhcH/YjgK/YiaL family protein
MQETIAYSAERDVAFYTGQGDWLTLAAGMFAVFFPQDVHRPGAQAGPPTVVKKVVMKVALQC